MGSFFCHSDETLSLCNAKEQLCPLSIKRFFLTKKWGSMQFSVSLQPLKNKTMSSKVELPQDYIDALPDDKKQAVLAIREAILSNLPKGYEEVMSYGMLGYVVPHALYPSGYHCAPKLPLPFISLAAQKHFIAVYHMGLYANSTLLEWFTTAYAERYKSKLDMGKSCMRFKKTANIPIDLIGELAAKMSVVEWIGVYEKAFKR
jgi:Domain of unknown function (DU1801)